MNCIKGDMAVVVRITRRDPDHYAWLIGATVTTVELELGKEFGFIWRLEKPITAPTACEKCGQRHDFTHLPDEWLQPIRPPAKATKTETTKELELA